jgi:tetratricopeptide (TPR) repeat protein
VAETALKQQYQRAEACRILGISERQLKAWERQRYIPAAQSYGFRELIALRTLRSLRAQRVPAHKIRRLLDSLKRLFSEMEYPLTELKIFFDGKHIAARFAGQNLEALTGQILFDFDTRELARVQPLEPPPPGPSRERESEACFQKGLLLEETGAPIQEAMEAYRCAVELNPQAAGALVNLGTIHYRLRQFTDAERYYTQAIEADPGYPLAHFNLGNLYEEWGEISKAEICYSRALRINPQYGDAHFNLALLSERTGDMLKAMHHWKAYLKLDNSSTWSDIARRQLEKLRIALLS